MESSLNDLIREFYLGDNSAWEKIMDRLSDKMKNLLNHRFLNLSAPEREACVPDWEVNFFAKVVFARQEAQKYIRDLPEVSSENEIERIKVEFCSAKTNFNPSLGVPFEAWMWKYIRFRAIDLIRKDKPIEETDDETNFETVLSKVPANPVLTGFQRGDNDEDVRKIKKLLKPALKGDEVIYLDLWFEKYGEPSAPEVKSAIQKETGKIPKDAYISNLKQSFLMKSYLKMLDHINIANALASLFQRLMNFSKINEKMFLLMMDNIWTDFYQNKDVVRKFKSEISADLWGEWEVATQRRNIQKRVLVKAYRYFRFLNPRPFFCFKIESYADNRFGGKIRELFLEGGAEN